MERGYHESKDRSREDESSDSDGLIDRVVAEAATRAERLFCSLRVTFCALVFSLSVGRELVVGPLRPRIVVAETTMLVVALGGSWLLRRASRTRILTPKERLASVALDALLAFLGLLPNILAPEAELFGSPDLGVVPVVVVTSLFRMLPSATYLAGLVHSLGVGVLVLLRPDSAAPGTLGDALLFGLYLLGAVAVARFAVERAFDIFRRVEESSRRATAARGGLTALLQDHHDTRSTLFELRLHLDRALETTRDASLPSLTATLGSLERGLDRLSASSNAARDRAYVALRSLHDLQSTRLDRAVARARAAFDERSLGARLDEAVLPPRLVTFGGGEEALARVLEQLFVNAAEGVDGRGATRIRFAIEESRTSVLLLLEDDGPGFPEEFFRRFDERRPFSTKSGSSGLGLLLLRHQLEAAGGRLEIARGVHARLALRFAPARDPGVPLMNS